MCLVKLSHLLDGREIWINLALVEAMKRDDVRPVTLIWMQGSKDALERYEVVETPEEIAELVARHASRFDYQVIR